MKKNPQNTNYDLKSDAVDALTGNNETPRYSPEELSKYRSKQKIGIPQWVKMVLLKAWFGGVVCFFIMWGLGLYLPNMLDMLFVMIVAYGLVTDLLVNNVIRFLEKVPGENDRWMLFPKKGMVSFGLNMLYSVLVIVGVYMVYNVINQIIISLTGNADTIPLPVEPILFGVFCMGIDMLLLGCKQMIMSVIRDAKQSAGRS